MSDESNALEIWRSYYDAWSNKDLDRAMAYVSEDIVCEAPAGRIEGRDEYRAFLGPFVQMLKSARLISAFGDADRALVMYDTETALVEKAPGAECVTVKDGKIVHSHFLFDRAPFEAARHRAAERDGLGGS